MELLIANLTCAGPIQAWGGDGGGDGAQDPALEMQATLCDLTTIFVVVVVVVVVQSLSRI